MSKVVITQGQYDGLPEELRGKLGLIGLDNAEELTQVDLEKLQAAISLTPADLEALAPYVALGSADVSKAVKKGSKKKAQADEPQPEPEQVKVRIVAGHEGESLVEWQTGDDLRRAWVSSSVTNLDAESGLVMVAAADLESGRAYGDDLESVAENATTATPAGIARALREAGIWTVADLLGNLSLARGAFNAAHSRDFERLVNAARQTQEE